MIKNIFHFTFYKAMGWRREGVIPDAPKYLYVVLPHTSNWDFVIGYMGMVLAESLKIKIFAKDSLFIFPLGWVCRKLGVLPVNRRESTNLVDQIVDIFDQHESLAVAITPEGTRGPRGKLKSGYYHIAKKANIPIVVSSIDYPTKRLVLSPARMVMSTFEEDQAALVAFAKTITAKNEENNIGNTFHS